MDVCTVQITPATAPVFLTKLKPEKQSMRKRRIKIKKLTTKQFRAMQNTIEKGCCNYLSERCVLYDDGDYPLCTQHGLRYLVCPYFRDVVIHNNADLMEELLGIPKNAKQCRECGKFFLPTHRNSLYCPICRERIAAEKTRKRSQKYRDRKKVNRHDC